MSEPATAVQIQEQNAPQGAPNVPESTERTFTQAEVDQIIADRLNRQKNKFSDYDALRAKAAAYDAEKPAFEQAQAEIENLRQTEQLRLMRETVSTEIGVPAALLTETTEEACRAQAAAILEFARPSGYPVVKDNGGILGNGQISTRDQFKSWFDQISK